jgi:hypothetical protein
MSPACRSKANADRRRRIPKQRFRATNWAEYNAALLGRGSLTGCECYATVRRRFEALLGSANG